MTENNPERKIIFATKLGADSWDDLFHELNQIIFELQTKKDNLAENMCISGGCSSSGSWAFKVNPSQTHDKYFEEIEDYLKKYREEECLAPPPNMK